MAASPTKRRCGNPLLLARVLARVFSLSTPWMATLLLLAACGCSDPGPTPVPAPPATAATGLGALSEAGRLAHQVLNDSETFADGEEGKGGPCIEGMAFRLLLREEPAAAKAAFADLREHSRTRPQDPMAP